MAKKTQPPDRRNPPQPTAGALLERQPPVDLTAEMGVLGSILLKPEVVDELVHQLDAGDFYDDAHAMLYNHFVSMHDANQKIDPTLLFDRLKSAGHYESIGGAEYIGRLINAVPNAAHAAYYANIVRKKSTFRALIDAATQILQRAYDEPGESRELLNEAEQLIFSILDNRQTSSVASIRDILHVAMDRIDARLRGDHAAGGVDTLFADLDALTGGLHNEELIILAARPSMGKTALAMNIAENVAIKGLHGVLFVSLEMSAVELADRLLCSVARVNGHRLRNGTLSHEDRMRLVEKAGAISQAPLFVDDSPSRTLTEIAATARRVSRRCPGGLRLIVIDYLQLIEPDNQNDSRQEQVARIARRLKTLARQLKVPVLCLAQLNRQAEDSKDHRPRLSHLRESGAIEQDADVVMFVHREEYYLRGDAQQQHAGQAEILVAKQRNGPVGDIELLWQKEFTRFVDKAPERLQEFDDYNAEVVGGF